MGCSGRKSRKCSQRGQEWNVFSTTCYLSSVCIHREQIHVRNKVIPMITYIQCVAYSHCMDCLTFYHFITRTSVYFLCSICDISTWNKINWKFWKWWHMVVLWRTDCSLNFCQTFYFQTAFYLEICCWRPLKSENAKYWKSLITSVGVCIKEKLMLWLFQGYYWQWKQPLSRSILHTHTGTNTIHNHQETEMSSWKRSAGVLLHLSSHWGDKMICSLFQSQ